MHDDLRAFFVYPLQGSHDLDYQSEIVSARSTVIQHLVRYMLKRLQAKKQPESLEFMKFPYHYSNQPCAQKVVVITEA